jgi:hypothetical protein
MKRSLFSVHPFYQFPDPIKRSLIRDPGRQALTMLDRAVEFDGLIAYASPYQAEATGPPVLV